MEDLEESITYNCEALSLYVPCHPDRSASFNNLANVFLTHYRQSGGMEDLEEVITYSLSLRPLTVLIICLLTRNMQIPNAHNVYCDNGQPVDNT